MSSRAASPAVARYAALFNARDWDGVPVWLEGREVLAVFRDQSDARPGYFVELTIVDGQVIVVRDFRYVPYIAQEAAIVRVACDDPGQCVALPLPS